MSGQFGSTWEGLDMNGKHLINRIASFTALVGLGAVSFTACGGSDDGGGTAESFCGSLETLVASGVDPNIDFDSAVKALEDLQSNSPGDLQGDVEIFINVLKRLDAAPENAAPEDFEEDLTNIAAAVENIQGFADSNCEGLPADIFS
jgi:hypothetical protein